MSTIKSLMFASLAASSFVAANTGTEPQTGPKPNKIVGPEFLTSTTSRNNVIGSPKPSTYTYEVDLSAPALVNTTIHIDDVTDAALPTVISITIPAGSQSGTFTVEAANPGVDVLVASNANGLALLNVTVL